MSTFFSFSKDTCLESIGIALGPSMKNIFKNPKKTTLFEDPKDGPLSYASICQGMWGL